MTPVDLDTFRQLLTDPGQQLLATAAELVGDPLLAAKRLRPLAGPELAAAALTQATLRVKAVSKFGDEAARMYFTPDGLEQATRTTVSAHRAARIAAAGGSVIDLGCGIGGDLIAFARAGLTAAGIDLDEVRVEVARANLAALGLGGAAEVADATSIDHSPFDVAFADPARRGGRGRTFDPDGWTPPWSFVESLLHRPAAVKVAPGIPHDLVPDGVEAEFVSDDGHLKEAVLWSGALATTTRRATVIGRGGLVTMTEEEAVEPQVGEIGAFLYEPDDAVIRAGLVTGVAAGVGGWLVDEHIAYASSDQSFRTPFARGYRVLEELPYREKQLRQALRDRGIGELTIKKRGVSVTPEELRKRLALRGEGRATIVLTRAGGHGRCWRVEPF